MAIEITLSPELEALLRHKASQQGQDLNAVASELLASALAWEAQDIAAAIAGIQHGLDDFEVGKSWSFQDFAEEQRLNFQ